MAKVETYSCDQCRVQKTKGNGWFRAIIKKGDYFLAAPWEFELMGLLLPSRVTGMPEDSFKGSEEKHYCSESCVAKAFSKTMGSGILAASADSNS